MNPTNDFIEFDRLPFYQQRYNPSPVSKSPKFKKLQQKWQTTKDKEDLLQNVGMLDLSSTNESPNLREDDKLLPRGSTTSFSGSSTSSPRSPRQQRSSQPNNSTYRSFGSPKRVDHSPKQRPYQVVNHALKDLSLPLKNLSSHSLNKSTHSSSDKVASKVKSTTQDGKKVQQCASKNGAPSEDHVQWVRATYMGRTYRFVRPARTFANQEAATHIQRIIRGGMQRYHYKIKRLEYLLETKHERTGAAIAAIHKSNDKRKANLKLKMEEKVKKGQKKIEQTQVTVDESMKVIEYLRRENKRLRESNQKIATAIEMLKLENARIESANTETDDSLVSIAKHAETIEVTHKKLMEVVPQFKAKVEEMEDALAQRTKYHDFERKVKVMYLKLMGEIAEKFEDNYLERDLADEIVAKCLAMEERELDTFGASCSNFDSSFGTLNNSTSKLGSSRSKLKSLGDHFQVAEGSDHAEEDEEIDAYTVHTMD